MSAFVCTNNRTFSCIIELAMKYEMITMRNLLAQRLYLLNVESVNQRYNLKETAKDEYRGYMERLADVRFEPQPGLHDSQRILAAHCWMYQSCEGDCDQDPLYKAVGNIVSRAEIDCARYIIGYTPSTNEAYSIVRRYLENNNLDNTWE